LDKEIELQLLLAEESLEEAKILFESRALYWSCIKGLYGFYF